ncbi:hypothetical protein [Nocardia sp. NBC_01327]|uniref:hypothetical protein n=1 Tax=Nocardia sp. NBC_01327 TaxID=2903593 RepID=UPI002E15AC68|nr:hypothetical protein OG326_31530 [Nocardia sp. NBC_01327]
MSDHTVNPQPQAADAETAERPMSRRERRGKPARKQSDAGPIKSGRFTIPATKRSNFVKE